MMASTMTPLEQLANLQDDVRIAETMLGVFHEHANDRVMKERIATQEKIRQEAHDAIIKLQHERECAQTNITAQERRLDQCRKDVTRFESRKDVTKLMKLIAQFKTAVKHQR